MTRGRRRLAFRWLDEVMPEVERLLVGHCTVGRWSLGQICNHLAASFRYSVAGFPDPPAPWPLRATLGRLARRSMLRGGPIPEGVPLPARYRPASGLDAAAEAGGLCEAIASFGACAAPAAHPLVGPMTHAEWAAYHLTHCAHHLSFVIPWGDESDGGPALRGDAADPPAAGR
jgi:hypothetical protein